MGLQFRGGQGRRYRQGKGIGQFAVVAIDQQQQAYQLARRSFMVAGVAEELEVLQRIVVFGHRMGLW